MNISTVDRELAHDAFGAPIHRELNPEAGKAAIARLPSEKAGSFLGHLDLVDCARDFRRPHDHTRNSARSAR